MFCGLPVSPHYTNICLTYINFSYAPDFTGYIFNPWNTVEI